MTGISARAAQNPVKGTTLYSVVPPRRAPWHRTDLPSIGTLWTHGYTNNLSMESLWTGFNHLHTDSESDLVAWARRFPGHGAFILDTGATLIALTDVAGTVPLYCATANGTCHLGANGEDVASAAGCEGVDSRAAYQIGLSGYTIGRRTITPGLSTLKPGEILVAANGTVRTLRHSGHTNIPDPSIDPDDPAAKTIVQDLLLETVERMAESLNGRQIMLPLSGGLDSRAILCGLKEVGYDNVVTFSYGLPGNHEAAGAERVARQLGYTWHMVPYSHAGQRAFFQGDTIRAFWEFADRPDAMPFVQDVPALQQIRTMLDIPEDAVFINGQSGDYNTGNHIPAGLLPESLSGLSTDEIRERIMREALAKHFDLWHILKTPEALSRLKTEIFEDIATSMPGDPTAENAFSAFELSEFDNRQSKYVVAGQRAYEFFGYDWRLPLWDRAFVEFWLTVPVRAKFRQRLYREALEAANWGNVWGPDWQFPRTVIPRWLRPIRMAAKLIHAPLGAKRWHRTERQYFNWIMDPVQNYAIASYGQVARDRRGHRNALSWHAEAYLERHHLSLAELT